MLQKRLLKLALIPTVLAALAACDATMPKVGDNSAKTVVTGSAGGGAAQNESSQLEKCARPLGTVALVEDAQADWFKYLTGQYKLTSTVPLLKLMVQQSNCFIVLDRGKAFEMAQRERALQQSGELRGNSNFGKGQMVSADYSISPEILISARGTAGGGAGALLGMFVPYAGLVAGAIQTNEASTMLTLVDNRSGVQVAAAEGSSKNTDFSLGGLFGGIGGGAGLGGYTSTPQGKVIAAAFMNSFNQMVAAAKNYTPQSMGPQGLGTGGKLAVDGAQSAPAAAHATGNNKPGLSLWTDMRNCATPGKVLAVKAKGKDVLVRVELDEGHKVYTATVGSAKPQDFKRGSRFCAQDYVDD